MNKYFFIILSLLIPVLACGNNYRGITTRSESTIHPILNMEVIEIPSPGKVYWIEGDAEIKKENADHYIRVILNTFVNENDILWLKKGANVTITFDNGTFIKNDPLLKDTFFTFEIVSPDEKNSND